MPGLTFENLAPEYTQLWATVTIRPGKANEVKSTSQTIINQRQHYEAVSAATGVPWFVVGLIHSLEASCRLTRHLHNGDPLTGRTFHVPDGRPKTGNPPFTWEVSAIDALQMKGLQHVKAWSVEQIAFRLEQYNGWGYRKHHPTVKSPYLWSCTNHYTSGKYVEDGKFNANAVSQQIGAMALLKHLIDTGVAQVTGQQSLPPPPPPPPPVPVPTGLYLADGLPFGLRAEARQDAARKLEVEGPTTVTKLKEVDNDWWEVQAAGQTGFARRDWLKEKTVLSSFGQEAFAQAVIDAAAHYGTSSQFLLALACADTGMANTAGPAGAFGPFALTEKEWVANNDPAVTGFTDPAHRFDALRQAAVAARFTVKLTEDARAVLPDKRLATAEELYIARIFGIQGLKALLEAAQNGDVRQTLSPALAADDITGIFASRPALLTQAITIAGLRDAMVRKLDECFENTVPLIQKIEPELVSGPPETIDDTSETAWMGKAKEQLAKNIEEIPGAASNPEIEKYYTATPLGRQHDDVPWCAAFVSWCVKESGGSQKPVTYSPRAADWLNNGDKLSGPQYGAVAVTRPLVPKASGHVGFVAAWDATHVTFLGGNQRNANGRDAVCERKFKIADVRGWRAL